MKNPRQPIPKPAFSDPLADVLRPGQSVELLKELHILTRDGKLNQDSRRKLKQVTHLCNFIEPLLNEVLDRQDTLTLADHGAGKSYLGFILYDLYLKERPGSHIYGIETRDELVEKSRALPKRPKFPARSIIGTWKAARSFVKRTSSNIRSIRALRNRWTWKSHPRWHRFIRIPSSAKRTIPTLCINGGCRSISMRASRARPA